MKRKINMDKKKNNEINIVTILLPLINDDTYKKIRKGKRLHNIKDTFIHE